MNWINFIDEKDVKWFYSYDFFEALIVRECMKAPLNVIPLLILAIHNTFEVFNLTYKRTYFEFKELK